MEEATRPWAAAAWATRSWAAAAREGGCSSVGAGRCAEEDIDDARRTAAVARGGLIEISIGLERDNAGREGRGELQIRIFDSTRFFVINGHRI
jgi:hypothetical protein